MSRPTSAKAQGGGCGVMWIKEDHVQGFMAFFVYSRSYVMIYEFQFTFLLSQRLVSDFFSGLTPGICRHVRLNRSKESRRRKRSKRKIDIVST
ncbi:hypothetical protein J6590_090487 [Homalodisca vitripennis]|nr:hypothetical protein J6590_090487 [Homalodisca vitripennis]